MACYNVRGGDDPLQGEVSRLFVKFVIPKNVLHVFRNKHILTKEDKESVAAKATNEGPSEGARLLFQKLIEKKDWFRKLQDVLRDQDVKLQHIAEIMMNEKKIIERLAADYRRPNGYARTAYSGQTLSSMYIKYNTDQEDKIRELFAARIDPLAVLYVFKKYSKDVLTTIDMENVRARVNMEGSQGGAYELLDRLVLYEDWFDVLLKVLNEPEVGLQDMAENMEELTHDITQDYKRKLGKILPLCISKTIQLADNRITPDDPNCVPMRNKSRGIPLQEDNSLDEYESDCPEMRPEAKRFASSYKNKENTVSDGGEGGRDRAPRGGSSEDGNATTSKTALMSAAAAGNLDLLQALIKGGCDVDESDRSGKTALKYAVCKSRVECVQLLISKGCNVNQRDIDGYTALMISADKGFTECMGCLIEGKSSVDNANNEGATALMVAAKKGRDDCVRLLIENRCDVNKCHNDGRTALMFAAVEGHSECVNLLISSGCDVNKCDNGGRTALMYAAFEGHSECVNLLIRSGCDVNKSNNKKTTALMFAVQNRHVDCVRLLINGCAELNLANHEGNTAVMYTVLHKETECLQLLVDSGADVNVINDFGYSPLKFAEEKQCRRSVKVLRAASGGR